MESSYSVSLVALAVISAALAVLGLALLGFYRHRAARARLCATDLVSTDLLRRNEARFRSLVQRSSDVILILDGDSAIRFASPAMARVFGYDPEEIQGKPLLDLLHGEDKQAAATYFRRATSTFGDLPTTVWRIRHVDGNWRHVESVGANLVDDDGTGIILNSRDITDRVRLEAQLTHQAFHDALTGLANRALFRDRVEHALKREGRGAIGTTVLFLDLDDFKTVNDSMGHAAGDRLLRAAALRLLNASRGCDTVARLGGDEFGVLLENVGVLNDAILVAERILTIFSTPFMVEGREVRVTPSVGVARAAEGDTAEDLLRNADLAMYRAKQKGRSSYEVFAPEMHAEVLDRLELEVDLRKALGGDDEHVSEFRLVYQPIVDLVTEQVIGLESLVRWDHPDRGMVPPNRFIPIAEKTGLILSLGRWILFEACREVASWDPAPPASIGDPEGRSILPAITVNISGHQLKHSDFVHEVAQALSESGLPANRLVLEVTESVVMEDTEQIIDSLTALRALGVRIAIDDFGTGYSSLSYLQRFPVDILKIDKTFVDRVAGGGQAAALTRMIIGLGDMLSLRMVAEGIEQADQQMHLKALGCGYGQGYYFARPMAAAEAAELVRTRGSLADGEAATTATAQR